MTGIGGRRARDMTRITGRRAGDASSIASHSIACTARNVAATIIAGITAR